jgi:pyruvate/2-oxoglutarate dehydrogenase complex dihydrolipoamide acyltransferase (E2) component
MTTRLRGWRKLAGSTWGPPTDPQFMGDLDVDAAELLAYAEVLRQQTGEHVTVTHLAGKAVGHALKRVPAMNVRLAHGRVYPRRSADVFFIVSTDGGDDLSGIKVDDVDRKSVLELAHEVAAGTAAIHDGTDEGLRTSKRLMSALPPVALRPALRLAAWLTSDLNLNLPTLGMQRQAFGGAMVTSVGMLGITHAYSPLASYYRVPVLVLVGAVTPRPVAVAGQVVVRPVLPLTATFDHRYVDGFQAAKFAHAVREYLEHPGRFESSTIHTGIAASR